MYSISVVPRRYTFALNSLIIVPRRKPNIFCECGTALAKRFFKIHSSLLHRTNWLFRRREKKKVEMWVREKRKMENESAFFSFTFSIHLSLWIEFVVRSNCANFLCTHLFGFFSAERTNASYKQRFMHSMSLFCVKYSGTSEAYALPKREKKIWEKIAIHFLYPVCLHFTPFTLPAERHFIHLYFA